jgi:hypothetical protein
MLLIFWSSFAVFVCFEGSNLLVPILHSNFLVLRSDFFFLFFVCTRHIRLYRVQTVGIGSHFCKVSLWSSCWDLAI